MPAQRSVELSTSAGPIRFETSPRGLSRLAEKGSRTLVFPPPNLFPPVFLEEHPIAPRRQQVSITWDQWDAGVEHNGRGVALAARGLDAQALKAYAMSWKANPDHQLSRYNAACSQARLGNSGEAMKLLEELHDLGGFGALGLLAAAANDPDLETLRSDPRFREITTATAPSPAWGSAMVEGASDEDDVLILSVLTEHLCLLRDKSLEGNTIRFARFDCDSGRARGELEGTREEVAATLDELGARRWARAKTIPEGMLVWARAALVTEEEPILFRSPSGAHLATRLEDPGADQRVIISAWPAQPVVAFLPDDGLGTLLSHGLRR